MIMGDVLTRRRVLRATGGVSLLPSVPMIIAPGKFLSKFFGKEGPIDVLQQTRTHYLTRTTGIAATASAVMSLAQPSREMLHIKIFEGLAGLCLDTHYIVKHTRESSRDRFIAQVTMGVKSLAFVALLIAKHNDDEAGGHDWTKVTS